MDYVFIGAGAVLVAFGFILGRLSAIPRLLDAKAEVETLKKLTPPRVNGRFVKRKKGSSV